MVKDITELMKPRTKVIGPYPKSPFNVGDVLEISGDCAGKNRTGSGVFRDSVYQPEKFPNIFQPLQWHEERKPDEMPEYVKKRGVIIKIMIGQDISESGSAWMFEKSPDGLRHRINLSDCLPATKEEFESYLTTVNKT